MASIKDSPQIEILHNEWCRANGYPVRWVKRQAASYKRQAASDMLNAANSERFVKSAKLQATSDKLQASSGTSSNKR